MPEIGEILKGIEIGHKDTSRYIWHACEDCGKERWVQFYKGQPQSKRCFACSCIKNGEGRRGTYKGNNCCHWKGGKVKIPNGYVLIWLSSNDFFYPMANHLGYVPEHRLVIARSLGRCLHPWEIVHHKDGIRDHNEIGNLQLVQEMQHSQITLLGNRIKRLEGQVEKQQKEIRFLKWQIKEKVREASNEGGISL